MDLLQASGQPNGHTAFAGNGGIIGLMVASCLLFDYDYVRECTAWVFRIKEERLEPRRRTLVRIHYVQSQYTSNLVPLSSVTNIQ
jgi:hypothetical protein